MGTRFTLARGAALGIALGACSHDAAAPTAAAQHAVDAAVAHAAPPPDPRLLAPFDPAGVAPGPWPHAMRGPFVDLDAYCLAFARRALELGGPDAAAPSCVPTESGLTGGASRVTGAGALFEARVLATDDGSGHGGRCRVAACTAQGWFVDSDGVACDGHRTLTEFALRDIVPGGEREVVLRGAAGEDVELTVCGLGPSRRPSCQIQPLAVPLVHGRAHGHDVAMRPMPETPPSLSIAFP